MNVRIKILSAILIGTVALSMTGCSEGSISQGKYDQIKIGMTQEQVEEIIGGSGDIVRDYGDGQITISYPGRFYALNKLAGKIEYKDGKVIAKSVERF